MDKIKNNILEVNVIGTVYTGKSVLINAMLRSAIFSDNKIGLCLKDVLGFSIMDEVHEKMVKDIITDSNTVVLYTMNAKSFTANDDVEVLKAISDEIKRSGGQSRDRFIFVITQCDELNEEKGETVWKVLSDVTDFLQRFDIVDPILIPVYAGLALTIRKGRNGETLYSSDKMKLEQVEDIVTKSKYHFEKYAALTPTVRKKLKNDADKYHKEKETWDLEALIHTGVPAVEQIVYEYIGKHEYIMENENMYDIFKEIFGNIISKKDEDKNDIFEVNVIGTMSSGKTTLINSLLHTELLPSKNAAYTATNIRILCNDDVEGYEAACYAADGRNEVHPKEKVTLEDLEKYNEDENIGYIDIEGNIPAFPSAKIKLRLCDTPGFNNSRNEQHDEIMSSIIQNTNAVVLYVINATQVGLIDDRRMLEEISCEMKRAGKQSRDRFIFIVSKCDNLDEDIETLEELLDNIRKFLKASGIVEPILIPTSARMALLIRRNLRSEKLSRAERYDLMMAEDFVEDSALHFEKYAVLSSAVRDKLDNDIARYHQGEETRDLEALIHTGIPAVEQTICEYIEKYTDFMQPEPSLAAEGSSLDGIDKAFQRRIPSLISENFFPEGIVTDTAKMFPMLVMATMSSGKSTLINALLGQQILPSENQACTAKKYSILDDDQSTGLKLYITDIEGNTVIKEDDFAEELSKANKDDRISEIFIRGQVKGVLNTDRALLIVDTPGPNNSRDLSHEEIMEEILGQVSGGLILYVMNATQLGIKDDKSLLRLLREYLDKHEGLKVLFVINKVDQLDEERGETIEELILSARDYLVDSGFDKPELIPVSALAASIFKKVLNGEELTRSEYRTYTECYELYKPKDFDMKSFAITEEFPNQFEVKEVRGKSYRQADILRAIENTGINLIEDYIQKEQILSSGQLQHSIKIKN